MTDNLANISLVMVRPCFLGNIGATARVMKNFGLSRLSLIAPPRNYKDAEARKMSVGAFDLLKQASVFTTLPEALKETSLVIGTSSAQNRSLTSEPFDTVLERAVAASFNHRVAILLGDERDGLSNNELGLCHHVTTIESERSFPSLNVAQAAAVIAYELSRKSRLKPAEVTTNDVLATLSEEDELFSYLESLFSLIEFTRRYNRDLVLGQIRGFYNRARPNKRECDLLKGIVLRLNQKLAATTSDN